ncbi:unnamed protein product [Fraxinus pennsylvanica]|uniref:RRM domain-containing protein n=1 Tax=Fraxinus pennsylvanica TaxID=56036 RepID=A0AAD1Z1U9_9LAMI|nr:unnamed protein product [Fraxinus pennsylvanica]
MGFKRQRLMDQGSSYYGTPPAPSYIYNAPPPPPPSYSCIPPPFPVVRLRGLPFDCTEAEIVDFFYDLDVVDVLFVHKGGQVHWGSLLRFGKDEYHKAIANEIYDSQGGLSRRGVPRARSFDEKDLAEYTGVLQLRGLPYTASKEDIMVFFKDFVLSESKIHMIANSEGRPTGEAFVEFASAEDSKAAMSKDRMTLKYRYIELFPSSQEELEETASSGRLLTKSFEGKDMGEPTTVVRMRGLPFSAGKSDIRFL